MIGTQIDQTDRQKETRTDELRWRQMRTSKSRRTWLEAVLFTIRSGSVQILNSNFKQHSLFAKTIPEKQIVTLPRRVQEKSPAVFGIQIFLKQKNI